MEDFFKINNKVIIITGAGGLLGQQHAEIIAAFGGKTVLLDKNSEAINKLSIKIKKNML